MFVIKKASPLILPRNHSTSVSTPPFTNTALIKATSVIHIAKASVNFQSSFSYHLYFTLLITFLLKRFLNMAP